MFATRRVLLWTGVLLGSCLCKLYPQQVPTFDQRLKEIMARPLFAHSRFGVEIYSVDTGKPIYNLHEQELFVPGSTTKLLTEGTAIEILGADYRFHTRVFRTGPVTDGTLDGDLVLVASGDPNLSNRIQSDGTLAFENEDHSYGGPDSKGLAGDRLAVIHELAKQIAAKNIKLIKGRLLIDSSLFPEGDRELGTGVVISPIVVNDNLVDVIASPGASEGAAVQLEITPQSSYVRIINKAVTGKAGSKASLEYKDEILNSDGTRSVVLTGSLAVGGRPQMAAYPVPEPSRYAAFTLQNALGELGVSVAISSPSDKPDFKALAAKYTSENMLAQHISPPLSEELKVTLKVSQNLHASMTPYLLGALVAKQTENITQAGFDLEHDFIQKAGLDLAAAAQSDGAGGNAYFTPDFMVQYLLFRSKGKNFGDFSHALPILGKDGTLFNIQVSSPAAGHVHAKTGTYGVYDALNKSELITGKGLAGYMETETGQHLVFALYVNNVSGSPDEPDGISKRAGETLGEIATAAYNCSFPQP